MTSFCRAAFVFGSLVALSLPQAATGAASFLAKGGALHDHHHGFKDLLHKLENIAGRDHRLATESRVERLETALRPMFAVMPKEESGGLNNAGVRYLLHRLFVQRHGWFVEGLDTDGGSWNSSSPAAVFKDHAADHHDLFDDHLNDAGFNLHQVAVMAATLETLVHYENVERLEVAYKLQGLSMSQTLTEEQAEEAIHGYMVLFVRVDQGTNISALSVETFKKTDQMATELYPAWPETEKFARAVRQRIVEDLQDDERTTWDTNLRVVEEIGERYGRWQAKECHVLKNQLVAMEKPGSGRVSLADFYGPAQTDRTWLFIESVPYLRELGALDESNPKRPSVIIANYLASPSNCVASSKFYSACCIDECEDLLSSLEQTIGEPEATPERIAQLVAALPADTVQAPRELSATLMSRLGEIAQYHGGLVPLHGRLFAQWLHHAYPRECPYPHVSGTTNPLTQEEWFAQGKTEIEASRKDIREIQRQHKAESEMLDSESAGTAEELMPWLDEEELFVSRPKLAGNKESGSSWSSLLWGLPLVFVAVMLIRPRSQDKMSVPDKMNHKYYV
jgi:hypothetical protein